MNYYRRYCGDYLRDTPDLTLAEHGAYTLLLDLYYSMGHPIPNPIELLYRICRATTHDEQAAVQSVANRFFPINGDGLRHNKRADIEIGISSKAIEKMRQAGINGAHKRWNGAPHRVGVRVTDATSNHHPPTTKERSKANTRATKSPLVLPDWIPLDHWNAWIEARTKSRKAPTDYAKRLAIRKLDNFREQGYAPAQVLMQSAFNNWAGLFPPKEIK